MPTCYGKLKTALQMRPQKAVTKCLLCEQLTVFSMGFGAVIGVLVALNNVNVGCQLDMHVVLSQIKRPVAPAIGMFCQFIFMPLISYGSSTLLLQNPVTRLGLFTIGSCPGGIYSNFYTLLFEGDLDLSVTMTFMSSVGALALMPLWMHTLGRRIAGTATPAVPFSNLIVSLVALTLPLGAGPPHPIQAAKNGLKWPRKIVKPFSVAILLVALVIGTYSYWYIVTLITLMDVVAASVVVVAGVFYFGATMAWLFSTHK
uniref:Putative sodium bile acid cotransporter n=1 Tax=Rhipicephalus microplus TaxID=6941 RepID=A0A6G5ABV2_RHIMP